MIWKRLFGYLKIDGLIFIGPDPVSGKSAGPERCQWKLYFALIKEMHRLAREMAPTWHFFPKTTWASMNGRSIGAVEDRIKQEKIIFPHHADQGICPAEKIGVYQTE